MYWWLILNLSLYQQGLYIVLQQEARGIRGRLWAGDDHQLCPMVSSMILLSSLKFWNVITEV